MARSLVLTVDYEIFGNGTGDVRTHVTGPTARMARICEQFGVPLTIFFEVEEYVAFERERAQLQKLVGYDPAGEIRAQLVELAAKGHDLQLHLHPEWHGTHFDVRSGWQLRYDHPCVDSLFETNEETADYIRERKAIIDQILSEAGSEQRVNCYRAGAFCAQPGTKLIQALAQNGFVLDTSLVRGLQRRDAHVALDFTAAPRKRHWRIRADVAAEEPDGPIFEVPIHSQMARRFQQFTPKRLAAKFSRNVPKEKQREMVAQLKIKRTPMGVIQFLLQQFPIKLDFHNMSAGQMMRWIRNAPASSPGEVDVIVLIGHTKEHRDDRDFERFLTQVSRDSSLEVVSMTEIARRLVSRLHGNGNLVHG
jgi:hypothetical protein